MTRKGLVSLVAATLLCSVAVTLAALWYSGYRVYAVRSGSMTPTLPVGSLVVAGPVVDGAISPGDVVTFRAGNGDPSLTTHRVVAVMGDELVTKGDANSAIDPAPVGREAVIAREITTISRAGFAAIYFQQPAGIASVMALAMWMLLLRSAFFPAEPTPVRNGRHSNRRHALV